MKNVQQGAKNLAKMLGWLLVWSVIGYLLLVLAYSLPVGRMKDHLRSEESTFTDGYYMLVRNDTSTQVDNITDSIILAEAVYDGPENPWQKAAAAFYASPQENEEHSESYLRIQAAVEDTGPYTQYARYWHGYLIFLKSLLLLLDYRDILRLNMIVQLFFMLLLAMLLQRRGKPQLLLPLVLMFAALTPAVTGLCLQYVPCFLILCVTSTVILYKPEFAQKHSTLLFLSTGMLVAYFDFLTYPLVTLGRSAGALAGFAASGMEAENRRRYPPGGCLGLRLCGFLGYEMADWLPCAGPQCLAGGSGPDRLPCFGQDRLAADRL